MRLAHQKFPTSPKILSKGDAAMAKDVSKPLTRDAVLYFVYLFLRRKKNLPEGTASDVFETLTVADLKFDTPVAGKPGYETQKVAIGLVIHFHRNGYLLFTPLDILNDSKKTMKDLVDFSFANYYLREDLLP